MNMKRHISILILALTVLCAPGAQASDALRADSAYNHEEYGAAIRLYQAAIATEGPDSEIYYNLGNAYYRNGNLGQAVIAYERSLRLDPTNSDARHNLGFVRSRIADRPEDDSSFLANMHDAIMSKAKPNTWAWTAFGVFLCILGSAALYIFARGVGLRKAGFFGAIVLVFLFLYTVYLAYDSKALATSDRYAVVTSPSATLTSAPRAARSATDPTVTIHEGTKVEITDSVATPDDPVSPVWYNVKINNGTQAWLRASDVEKI